MKYFAGLMAVVALVAGATFGAYHFWDEATHTHDDNGGVLAIGGTPQTVGPNAPKLNADQVIVSGTLTSATFDGAALGSLPTPFTVTPTDRGVGGATFSPVVVNGNTTSIDWQAGQPLPLEGDGGSLTLGAVTCTVADGAITVLLDGVQGVTPGDYTIKTSVAVGSQPRDSVTFTATDKTTVEFRSGATAPLATTTLDVKGTGNVTLEGALSVVHPDRTKTPTSAISLQNGVYRIILKPNNDGTFALTATLQGATS